MDPNTPRVITIKRIRMPHNRYTAQTIQQAPQEMESGKHKNTAKIPVAAPSQRNLRNASTKVSKQYYEMLAQRFRDRDGRATTIAQAQDFFANPEKYTQNPPSRIPLERRAIFEPTDRQLISWSWKEGIAQRLGVTNPSDNSQFTPAIMAKLRAIYQACLERWNAKNNQQ